MNKQYRLEDALTNEHLVEFDAQQFVHDGLYCKTIYLKKGETISGKLVEKPAVLIINGNCRISIGGKSAHIYGYKVFNVTDINAQQSIEAFDYTSLTMIIKTAAKNTQEFEAESRTMPSAMPVSPSTIDY